jgi:hypothetical protein
MVDLADGRRAQERGRAQDDKERVTACCAPASAPAAAAQVRVSTAAVAVLMVALSGCSGLPRPESEASFSGRRFTATVLLHGEPLELHLSAPRTPAASGVVVLYASGDGGWFGTAVDMFRQVADAGYPAVGFSSRSFLKIQRPRGAPLNSEQLAAEYEQIVAKARIALGLEGTVRTVLTGWSRGAAFAVLVGSEPTADDNVLGVVAIGLAEGEDLNIDGPEDETDGGIAGPEKRKWPFETYARIPRVGPRPCAVIQATGDGYLPAARARQLFGPDTPLRRFYTIDAKNHRFSAGGAAFTAAWLDAIRWMVSPPDSNAVR